MLWQGVYSLHNTCILFYGHGFEIGFGLILVWRYVNLYRFDNLKVMWYKSQWCNCFCELAAEKSDEIIQCIRCILCRSVY